MKTSRDAPPKPRQRPGSACQECRRRKLRCDGQRPQCQACAQSGAQCIAIVTHAQRGPKKGHVKALETRLGTLPDPDFAICALADIMNHSYAGAASLRAAAEEFPHTSSGLQRFARWNECGLRFRPGRSRQLHQLVDAI